MRDGRDRLDAGESEAELLATMEDMPEPARKQLGPKAVEVLTKLQPNPQHNEALAMFAPLLWGAGSGGANKQYTRIPARVAAFRPGMARAVAMSTGFRAGKAALACRARRRGTV